MDELIRDHLYFLTTAIIFSVAAVIGGLYKLGWLRLGPIPRWNGNERRMMHTECVLHPGLADQIKAMSEKVDRVDTKVDRIDSKVDSVAERQSYVLGLLKDKFREYAK